jgi:hypothetical protein
MEFRSTVEPPEPMHGLEIPPGLVESLGGGKRPRVVVTLGGHTWRTRVAILRGRDLIGLSNANRAAAGVAVGDEVTVGLELDDEPETVTEPDDVAAALDAAPAARAAFDRLSVSRRKQHVRVVEQAKRPETRAKRVAALVEGLAGTGTTPG